MHRFSVSPAPVVVLFVTVAVALVPSYAGASTYCAGVSGGDCATSYPATGAGLKSALLDADTFADLGGTPDTVRIGPGTYASATGFTTMGGDISIVGSGESTILTAADAGGPTNAIVLNTGGGGSPAISASHLQIRMDGAEQDGGLWDFREVSDVHIGGSGTLRGAGIILPVSGGRVTRTLIDPAGMDRADAISGKSMTVEDTLIRVRGDGGPSQTYALRVSGPIAPGAADVTLRHVTILGNGASNAGGVRAQGLRAQAGTTSVSVHLRDSLLHGLATPLELIGRAADTGTTPCTVNCFDGLANADSRYSSVAVASIKRSGPGTYSLGPGDLPDPEPLLSADGGLLSGSPLINAGDPAGAEAGDSATDLAGSPRIRFGRRDIGALESPFAPIPPPAAPGAPVVAVPGSPVISSLALSRRRFRVGALPRRGTRIRFALSAPADYTLRIERVLRGRLLTRRGKPPACKVTRARARASQGKRCTTSRLARTLTGTSAGGALNIPLSGRVGRKRLVPGVYRLTVQARDSAGRLAAPQQLSFTVIR